MPTDKDSAIEFGQERRLTAQSNLVTVGFDRSTWASSLEECLKAHDSDHSSDAWEGNSISLRVDMNLDSPTRFDFEYHTIYQLVSPRLFELLIVLGMILAARTREGVPSSFVSSMQPSRLQRC